MKVQTARVPTLCLFNSNNQHNCLSNHSFINLKRNSIKQRFSHTTTTTANATTATNPTTTANANTVVTHTTTSPVNNHQSNKKEEVNMKFIIDKFIKSIENNSGKHKINLTEQEQLNLKQVLRNNEIFVNNVKNNLSNFQYYIFNYNQDKLLVVFVFKTERSKACVVSLLE